MALTVVNIACGYPDLAAELFGNMVWSEQPAASVATTKAALPQTKSWPVFEFCSSSDILVTIGQTPDLVNGPFTVVFAGITRDLIGRPGDKAAWKLAT